MQPGSTHRSVSLSELKRFALSELSDGSLRADILAQPDELDAKDFLASVRVWLRLARAT